MSLSKFSLDERVALVTGASRGLGFAIARALAEAGATVVLNGREIRTLEEKADDIRAEGWEAEAVAFDVTDHAAVAVAIQDIKKRHGGLDILIANAGIQHRRPLTEFATEDFQRVIDTNLTGVFNACHAAIPHMRRRGGGFIVNVSSLAGKNAFAGAAAYCASKTGLNAFSEALMQEVRYDNIRVSYVMPGSVATGFGGNDEKRGADWKLAPEDVAEVVLDLLRHDPRSLPSRVEIRPSKPRK
mgnify:CR=1 FL=1